MTKTSQREVNMLIDTLLEGLNSATNAAELAYKARNFPLTYASLEAAQQFDFKLQFFHKNRMNWTLYHDGLANAKFDEQELQREGRLSKAQLHAKAIEGCDELLRDSEGMEEWIIESWISTVDLLMLLKPEEKEALFRKGKLMLNRIEIPQANKDNEESKLLNSLAMSKRRTDPNRAIRIFQRAYRLAKHKTVNQGNPLQGESDCWKNLLMEAKTESSVIGFYEEASKCLTNALDAYPDDETGHLNATRKRIEDLKTAKEKRMEELKKMKKTEGITDDRK